MKKNAVIIVITCIFMTLFPTVYNAIEMPIRVVVNGKKISFPDAQPFIDSNNRTQTPARFIGESLGATAKWDDKAKKATFVSGSKTLVLYIGKKEYDLNGQKNQMDTVALLKNGRTFVPARYVAEAFGSTVRWDGAVKTVYIDIKGSTPEPRYTPVSTVAAASGLTAADQKAIADRFRELYAYDIKMDKKNIFRYLSTEYKTKEKIKTYEDIVFPVYKDGGLFPINNPNYMPLSDALIRAKERIKYPNDNNFIVLCLAIDLDKEHYKLLYGLFDNYKNLDKIEAYYYGSEVVVKENNNWYFSRQSVVTKGSEWLSRKEYF